MRSRNTRVEKATNRTKDPRQKQKQTRQASSNREGDLPEDAKDPWGGDEGNVVINPVASVNEDPNRYWNQQNQWQQVAPPQQPWMPMQAPPTLPQPGWGPPIAQMPILDQNARQAVAMHRPIAPLMNQPQLLVPGMAPPPQMCPPAQMPCNGIQQNWNQNVPPQPQMGVRMSRFQNPHAWRNPNFNKAQNNARQ